MMSFQLKASMTLPSAKALISEGSPSCSQRGPDAAGYPTYRSFRMGGPAPAAAAARQNIHHPRRKFPPIKPLSKSQDAKSLLSGLIVGGSPNLAKDDRLDAENNGSERDVCGRHFLFDKCGRFERTRTVIPPLPRDFHRPGNLHPFSLSKELSHSHAGRPFTLGYDLNTSPSILFPSTLVLNGTNTFSVGNCKLSRPKVTHPANSLLHAKDNQKSQSYADPMVGASRSFIHRISELSSLEGETARQEKLKKLRKSRNPPILTITTFPVTPDTDHNVRVSAKDA